MDVSGIIGEELLAVEFVQEYLQLRFAASLFVLYAWPHVLFPDFSVAYGEPEYRNALCAQIGDKVVAASLEEGDSLTIEFENGTVFGLSLREEDLDGPESGNYSESGSAGDAQEF